MSSDVDQRVRPADAAQTVTAFICANCGRPGQTPDSGGRPRPSVPKFDWPFPVEQVLVPCAGRLQPEHVLKAFESGSDLVCAVACEEDDCHYLEGSKRCARRVEYLKAVLDEVGLGAERLLLVHLPGSAAADMALGARRRPASDSASEPDAAGEAWLGGHKAAGTSGAAAADAAGTTGIVGAGEAAGATAARAAAVAAARDEVVRALAGLTRNPLHPEPSGALEEPYEEVDISDDDNED